MGLGASWCPQLLPGRAELHWGRRRVPLFPANLQVLSVRPPGPRVADPRCPVLGWGFPSEGPASPPSSFLPPSAHPSPGADGAGDLVGASRARSLLAWGGAVGEGGLIWPESGPCPCPLGDLGRVSFSAFCADHGWAPTCPAQARRALSAPRPGKRAEYSLCSGVTLLRSVYFSTLRIDFFFFP